MNKFALIVDDDAFWLEFLARTVERVGLEQDLASTAHRAIELIRRRTYAIVLLDADLGTEQGYYGCTEVLAELKAKGSEVPTIIVSGREDVLALTNELTQHYSAIIGFSKAGNLLELEKIIRQLAKLTAASPILHTARIGQLAEYIEYGFSFMKIDIIGHSAICDSNRGLDVDETLDDFEKFVEREVVNYKGHIFSWQGDGGLTAFVAGPDTVGNCGEAALSILYSLRQFNDYMNKTNVDVRVRIACHQGTAKYKSEHGRIHSAAINFVCHLEAKGTSENSISISEKFYKELPAKVRARFRPKGTFEGVPIYEHCLANT
jgi:CheY-like chemotaxis protein/class 3 adenylate cyclase